MVAGLFLLLLLAPRDAGAFGVHRGSSRQPTGACASRQLVRQGLSADVDVGAAPFLVAGFAVVLGAAGKLQYDAYSGDDGLGAHLRDGDGYSNSAYKPKPRPRPPAPSEGDVTDVERAETMRLEILAAAADGDVERARRVERDLEALLARTGISFSEEADAPP